MKKEPTTTETGTPRAVIEAEAAALKSIYKSRKSTFPNLNQYALADMCGWSSQGTVSQYMSGKLELNLEALMLFAKALNFDPSEVSTRLADRLYKDARISEPLSAYLFSDNVRQPSDAGRMLPVVGQVQAGSFCEAVDIHYPGDADEWAHSGGPVGDRAFVLVVDGISMVPDFNPGDRVVIDPEQQSNPGHFVLARRASDNSVTLKKLRKEGSEYYLEATNPSWPERIIKLNEEWSICGRARRKIVEL